LSDATELKHSGNGGESVGPGVHSLAEILSQVECWQTCLKELAGSQIVKVVAARFNQAAEWLFIGCGSSYYVALAAAATMKSLTGRSTRAIPASEISLYPELVLSQGPFAPVLISRSGQTSEVLKAAEVLQERSIPSVAVSCVKGQALEKLATLTITLPADEQSTVMTRSFTSMLLALQLLAGRIAGNEAYCDALIAMPELAAATLKPVPEQIHDFVARHNTFADYVCLGHGPFYGLACEYALKVMEMSVSSAQFFHSLEFRHGPKSVVTPHTLLIFLLSEQGYEAECDLLEEVKSLGGTTLVIAPQANSRVRAADLLVELPLKLPELARLAPSLVPGQLLGLYTGLKKGLNPDSPRHLSRAVILNDNSSQRSEHATF